MTLSAIQLQRDLTDWTVRNSGHDEHRNYIGLSSISDCRRAIYDRFFNRVGQSIEQKLKTRSSYEIENNIKFRLKEMGIYSPGIEIVLYDGLVNGHTDGEVMGSLLEIKTVPMKEHIPASGSIIPFRVRWQVQTYMHYGKYQIGLVLYYARDTGIFRVFDMLPMAPEFCKKTDRKIKELVEAVTSKKEPACECGRCERR